MPHSFALSVALCKESLAPVAKYISPPPFLLHYLGLIWVCTTFEDMKVFRCFFHLFAGLYMTLCKRPSTANSPYLKVNCVTNIQFSRQLFFSLFNATFSFVWKAQAWSPSALPWLATGSLLSCEGSVTQMCTMLHFVLVFHNEFVSLAFGKNLKVRFIIAISSPFHPPHFVMFLLSHYPQVYSQTWFIKASLLPLNYPPVDSGKHLY